MLHRLCLNKVLKGFINLFIIFIITNDNCASDSKNIFHLNKLIVNHCHQFQIALSIAIKMQFNTYFRKSICKVNLSEKPQWSGCHHGVFRN